MHLHVDNLIFRRGNTRLTNHIFTIDYTNRNYSVNINGENAVYSTSDTEECTLDDVINTCKSLKGCKRCIISSSIYLDARPDDYDLFVLLACELLRHDIDINDVILFDSYPLRKFKESDSVFEDCLDPYELLEAKFYTLVIFSTARLWGDNIREKAIRILVEIANHYIYSNSDIILNEIDKGMRTDLPFFVGKDKGDGAELAGLLRREALIDHPHMLNLAATFLDHACRARASKREKIGDRYITNAYVQILNAYRAFLNTCDLKLMCDFTNDMFYSVLTDSTFNVMFKGLRGCMCLLDRGTVHRKEIYSILYRLYSRHVYVGQLVLGAAYVVTNDDTVDIVMEAIREFGMGNVSEEKYKMPLML